MLRKRGLVEAGLCCCVSVFAWAQYAEAATKVTICHSSAGKKYSQLSVDDSSVPAHLAHGDCVVDDGVACTVDSCDAVLGCVHAPDNGACDDGNACTKDSCDPKTGCVNSKIDCNDGNACTLDGCNRATGCVNDKKVHCDDNNACTTDTCDPATGCVHEEIECEEAEECEVGSCDPATGCVLTPRDIVCGDGVVCAPEECETDADCPAGSACSDCTCCPVPPTADECDKDGVCAAAATCGPTGTCACFFTAAGNTRCFDGEFGCNHPPCTSDCDCAEGSACSATCCGLQCTPLCAVPPPPVNECERPVQTCDVSHPCTNPDGCDGVCHWTTAGVTKCFFSEYGCDDFPACVTDSDCAAGTACGVSCCPASCVPLCGVSPGTVGPVGPSSSKAPPAAQGIENRTGKSTTE